MTSGERDFTVPFPYLAPDDVGANASGVAVEYTWLTPSRIRVTSPMSDGALLVISRVTPIDLSAVVFQNGAVLTSEDLNTATLQLLYKQQELVALYEGSLLAARIRIARNNGIFETDPQAVVDGIANLVLESEVLSRFQAAIADVDLNAETIIKEALGRYGTSLELTKVGKGLREVGARVTTEVETRISENEAFAQRIDTVDAVLVDEGIALRALVGSVQTALVTEDEALASRIDTVDAVLVDEGIALRALVGSVQTALVTEDEALASRIEDVVALAGANAAAITEEVEALATAISAEATARESLAVSVGDQQVALTDERTARIDSDGVFTQAVSLLGYVHQNGDAFILNQNSVVITDTNGNNFQNLAGTIQGLSSRVGSSEAAIVEERNVRSTQYSSTAQINTLITSQVGPLSSSVGTLSTAVNGISAKWGVSLTANGFVSGVVLNNDGASSSFNVLADRFAVVDPNQGPGQTPQTVFEIVNGVTRIRNLVIGSANIETNNLALASVTRVAAYQLPGVVVPTVGEWSTVGDVTLSVDAGTLVRLDAGVGVVATSTSFASAYVEGRWVRDGFVIRTAILMESSPVTGTVEVDGGVATVNIVTTNAGTYSVLHVDAPTGARSVTYYFQVLRTGDAYVRDISLLATEIRR